MTTAIVHHPIFKQHDTGPGHPETSSRYSVVMDALKSDVALWEKLLEVEAQEAPKGDIQACHSPNVYKMIEQVVRAGSGYLDADTFVSMRPPGHHATSERSMGFCLFNNVAVAARYAQNKYREIERVAIVDWDVH